MNDGNRTAQIAVGIFLAALCGVMLVAHYWTGHEPHPAELWVGGLGLFVAAALIAPMGMEQVARVGRMIAPWRGDE